MLKAKATLKGDRPLYVFGLSARNLELLKAGRPMRVLLEDMGGTGEVLITYGETQMDIARDLHEFIGPNTKIQGADGIFD